MNYKIYNLFIIFNKKNFDWFIEFFDWFIEFLDWFIEFLDWFIEFLTGLSYF